ncbi:MAG: hypothetical protein ABW036_05990 [Flavitalea sp.]
MTLEYNPGSGFSFESFQFDWSTPRALIREKLNNTHKNDDKVIELAQYFDGDESHNIHQFRDIYENYNSSRNYFFLSYDKDGFLTEVEVHWGIPIKIHDQVLEFEAPLAQMVERLSLYDNTVKETEEGNYFFPKLKISVATGESMGGDGDGLSYFYAGKNVDHLM